MQTFLGQLQQDAIDYEQNTPEYTYQRNETVFFPENSTDFCFSKASGRDSKQNRIFLERN